MYAAYMYMYLRGGHQVHLEQPCLEGALSRSVVLEGIEKEGGTLLHHVHLHEYIHNLREVNKKVNKKIHYLCN